MTQKTISTDVIETFLERLRAATKSRSREIRLGIEEAQELAVAISQILTRDNQLFARITELQDRVIMLQADRTQNSIQTIEADAGMFPSSEDPK